MQRKGAEHPPSHTRTPLRLGVSNVSVLPRGGASAADTWRCPWRLSGGKDEMAACLLGGVLRVSINECPPPVDLQGKLIVYRNRGKWFWLLLPFLCRSWLQRVGQAALVSLHQQSHPTHLLRVGCTPWILAVLPIGQLKPLPLTCRLHSPGWCGTC